MSKHAAAKWKGEVGDRWLKYLDQFESMLSVIGEAAIAQGGFLPGENVADIGCGGGMTSMNLADIIGPSGRVTGVDIAPQLIEEAGKRAAGQGLSNVTFEAGDAQLHTPENAPFDRIFSRFGVMFFDDTLAGFKNMRSWLKPGGELSFATWAKPEFNPWMTEMAGIVGKYVEVTPPDPEGPGPFRLADEDATRAMLEDAGFTDITIQQWTGDQYLGGEGASPEEALSYILQGLEIEKALSDLDEATKKQAVQELAELLKSNYRDGSVTLQASALLVKARNP